MRVPYGVRPRGGRSRARHRSQTSRLTRKDQMLLKTNSSKALTAAILLAVFSVGCKSGGGSTAPSSASTSQPIPTPLTYPEQQPAADFSATTPVSTQRFEGPSAPTNADSQFCPVTGARLGSMGEPVPVNIDGRIVHVCCSGCVTKLKQNPQKYLRTAGSSGYSEGGLGKDFSSSDASESSSSSCGSAGGGCGGCH